MEILVFVIGLAALDVIAVMRGTDSRDGVYSQEWDRRKEWRGFDASSR